MEARLVSCRLGFDVYASTLVDISVIQLMEFVIEVMEVGLRQRNKLVDAIFSYISILVDDNMPQYVYEEVLHLCFDSLTSPTLSQIFSVHSSC